MPVCVLVMVTQGVAELWQNLQDVSPLIQEASDVKEVKSWSDVKSSSELKKYLQGSITWTKLVIYLLNLQELTTFTFTW